MNNEEFVGMEKLSDEEYIKIIDEMTDEEFTYLLEKLNKDGIKGLSDDIVHLHINRRTLKILMTEYVRTDNFETINAKKQMGFKSYNEFRKTQKTIIDNSTNEELCYYIIMVQKIVGNREMYDVDSKTRTKINGMCLSYDSEGKPKINFF